MTACHELWTRGVLKWQMRPHKQTELYDWIDTYRARNPDSVLPVVINAHRRFGKSHVIATKLVEDAVTAPGRVLRYVAPLFNQVESILHPILATILRTCPKGMFEKCGDSYYFSNPKWAFDARRSELHLHGADGDRADRLRGLASDVIALDEVRDIANLQYLVTDVLIHHFSGRKNPFLVMESTPPASMDHDFSAVYIPKAIDRGTYVCIPGSSNKDFAERDRAMLLAEVGDEGSESWRREIECELISSSESVIIPEFYAHKAQIVVEGSHRPQWFIPLTCGDLGMTRDASVILFGYVDFDRAALVVEDELHAVYKNTQDLADLIKAKEQSLGYAKWDGPKQDTEYAGPAGHKVRRNADGMASQHLDFATLHGLCLELPEKYSKDMAINSLRDLVASERIRISARCKHLVYQLEHGAYNKQRTDFARSARLFHCDAVDALVYMNRMAPWTANPKKYPRNTDPGMWDPEWKPERDGIARALSNVGSLLRSVRGER